MIDYRFQGRLNYIPGGALNVQMSAWPTAGGNWWEPTTGSYTVVAAYQPKGAASLAASYSNLANPGTYDLTTSNAPSFDTATGWTFATLNILNTTINALSVVTNSGTIIARFNVNGAGGNNVGRLVAAQLGGSYLVMEPNTISYHRYRWGIESDVNVSPALTGSHIMAMAAGNAYLDGAFERSWTATNPPNANLTIGNNSGNSYLDGSIQALAIYSTTLDATQVSEITDNMNAL